MNRAIILSTVLATALFANSIGQEEQYTDTNDKSTQKSFDKSKTDEKSKTITKEKGQEVNQGSETSKSKEKEQTLSKEESKIDSQSKSMKRLVDMQATKMMPEVGYLVNKFINHNMENVKTFIEELNPSLADFPIDWQQYFNWKLHNFNDFTQMIDRAFEEEDLVKRRHLELKSKPWSTENSVTLSVCSRPSEFAATNAFRLPSCVINIYQNKYINLLIDFFNKYGLPIKSKISIGTNSDNLPRQFLSITKAMLLDIPYSINFGGDTKGELYFSLTQGMKSNFTLFNKDAFIQYKPSENSFMMAYRNIPIIGFDNNEVLHFYGDLVFNTETRKQSIVIIDKKINADGLNLSIGNQYNKFDDYFKKLMKLYLEAFNSVNISENETYSLEEIQYRAREYLYKKITGKDDFLERYLSDPSDFWKPRGEDLINFPRVQTSYNDVIFSKSEGYILNQKISFNIETSDSVQQNFNESIREAKSEKFAENIKKAINQFKRENKQDMARLAMQLANKIVSNENYLKKQDLINRASTSTDILKSMLDIVK